MHHLAPRWNLISPSSAASRALLFALCLASIAPPAARAQDRADRIEKPSPASAAAEKTPADPAEQPVEQSSPAPAAALFDPDFVAKIAHRARPAIVEITALGRDGQRHAMGTGFVIDAAGLVATNLHVIGEGRAITVRTADGRSLRVTSVHATDRVADLAILRVDAADLPVLELADSDAVAQGEPVVAIGNPLGLKYSVVAGVVSARRELEGRQMIQLAIPIEPGNSGGPLLDRQGRVCGVLTMKSRVHDNLGFAVESNALRGLIEKPNPVAIDRWLTIGALDPRHWKPLFGAQWRQRAGRILVEGSGDGFGGRSLCLNQHEPPARPFEAAVDVRLDDESGAAGLVFCADGGDRHYGFYPTSGKLRLTRFEGPNVFAWHVLAEVESPHYRPGEWNTIKIRLEADKIVCSVNGQTVIESTDRALPNGKLGLAKFRQTQAQFRRWRVGASVADAAASPDQLDALRRAVDELLAAGEPSAAPLDAPPGALADAPDAAAELLRRRACRLDDQAARLRELAASLHHHRVLAALAKVVQVERDDQLDLVHAALLIAWLDNEDVEVEAYRAEVERMAAEIAASLDPGAGAEADDAARLAALNRYLFAENGYHGSRSDYYHRSNSYLNEVIDDREGLPITLSLLYMELARRIGLKVVGVGLPGHFVVRHLPADGQPQLIDVFEGGTALSLDDAAARVLAASGAPLADQHLAPASHQAILLRMLQNLLNLAQREQDPPGMLRYLDAILTVSPRAGPERAVRAIIHWRLGRSPRALEDLDWLLEHQPPDVDLDQVRRLREQIVAGQQ